MNRIRLYILDMRGVQTFQKAVCISAMQLLHIVVA